MEALAEYVVEPDEWGPVWDERQSWLVTVQEQARYSVERGKTSLRANPRAMWWGYRLRWREDSDQWSAPSQLNKLERDVVHTLDRLDLCVWLRTRTKNACRST
ncbi:MULTISPECIES: hypothetical protein [unclassified Spirillospora]|uniref:hypothetical protein n=1 Tax=unclassified Spirillospora TaxID=2642701 RepID=UPI003715199A